MLYLIFAAAAVASQPNCSDPPTQADMNDCALAEFDKADAELNAQWKKTFAVFKDDSEESASRLRAAQRAWIAYRDAECDAEHWFDLGVSLDHGLNIMCRTALTQERTAQLAKLTQDD